MPHEVSKITSAADQGHLMFRILSPLRPLNHRFSTPTPPSFVADSKYVILLTCLVSCMSLVYWSAFFIFLWCCDQTPDIGFLLLEVSREYAPQLVRLLWTSDQFVAETSTWQHTLLTTNIHDPGGIQTHNRSRHAAADLRPRPRGHWDRHEFQLRKVNTLLPLYFFSNATTHRLHVQSSFLFTNTRFTIACFLPVPL